MRAINKLIKGNKRFRDKKFVKLEDRFTDLVVNGQRPEILFIGCCDSRVVPDLIVNAKPGELFIHRNIGNFIPPYKFDEDYHGSSAAIEYAVSVLGVRDIIVCGHSYCGACASLYDDLSQADHLVHVRKWLELGEKAKIDATKLIKKKDKKIQKDKQNLFRLTEKASIKHQLDNLMTYPQIKKKVKKGELELHGWYYKIEDGSIECFDGDIEEFVPLGS